jgi:hypothetical protein
MKASTNVLPGAASRQGDRWTASGWQLRRAQMDIEHIDGIANWDLHPDGNRFVVIVPQGGGMAKAGSGSEPTLRFLVTLNWFDELRRALRAQRP